MPEKFVDLYKGWDDVFWDGYNDPEKYICYITHATRVRESLGHVRDHIIDKFQVQEYYADPINAESGIVMPEPEVVFKLRTKPNAPTIPISDFAKRNVKQLQRKFEYMQ